MSPQDSLKQIVVDPGLKVELVASEPNVMSPVAVRFDEDGRMWVVEMCDYPTGPTKKFPQRSRISILTDKDGDGFFETATVFADDLSFATGVQPWKGGVFVTMAGQSRLHEGYERRRQGRRQRDLVHRFYAGQSATAGESSDAWARQSYLYRQWAVGRKCARRSVAVHAACFDQRPGFSVRSAERGRSRAFPVSGNLV